MGMGIRRPVLPLEADGLVDDEMTHARKGGSANRERNDDTCRIHEYEAQHEADDMAHREESTQAGST